jgi:hypothetical protein
VSRFLRSHVVSIIIDLIASAAVVEVAVGAAVVEIGATVIIAVGIGIGRCWRRYKCRGRWRIMLIICRSVVKNPYRNYHANAVVPVQLDHDYILIPTSTASNNLLERRCSM